MKTYECGDVHVMNSFDYFLFLEFQDDFSSIWLSVNFKTLTVVSCDLLRLASAKSSLIVFQATAVSFCLNPFQLV